MNVPVKAGGPSGGARDSVAIAAIAEIFPLAGAVAAAAADFS
jgi:hypothetical protein